MVLERMVSVGVGSMKGEMVRCVLSLVALPFVIPVSTWNI
jgi:hypothetical protein